MNKYLIVFILISFYISLKGQSISLREVRENYQRSIKDEDLCEKYYELLKSNAKTHVEKGYEAAFQMFMAKHTANPIKKMRFFNKGKELLETQIKESPSNVDLRFIRLSIQYHTPAFLGYKDKIQEDRLFLVENFYKKNEVDGRFILLKYLKGMNLFTEQELLLLER